MQLVYFMPTGGMRNHLTTHAVVTDVAAARVEVLPAMLPNIYIRLAGRSSFIFADGKGIEGPPVSLVGPTANAYGITLGAGCLMAVVGLLPLGWAGLMGVPGVECVDSVLDGADIWGGPAVSRLIERLSDTALDGNHVGLVETFLMQMVTGAPRPLLRQMAVIDHWLEHSSSLSLDDLCAELEVGARQMRRITIDGYGLSPKTLAMKYRALRMAALMCQGGGLDAAAHVYADQSHMIRDFRRFIGSTPAAFIRDPHNIAAATIKGRQQAGATRPLVLLS